MSITTVEVHPLAALIPEMTADQFSELRSDIEQHGLIEAITLHEGMVLDGRHRLRACDETGVEPRFEDFNGPSPVEFVLSKNLKRRHLTAGQLAAVGLAFRPAIEAEAKERQRAAGRDFGRGVDSLGSEDHNLSPGGKSRETVGALVGVSGASIDRAQRVEREDPEAFEQVKAGTKTLTAADREIRERPKKNGYRDGSHKRSSQELVTRVIGKLLPTVAALEHFNSREAIVPEAPLAQWDKELTDIIVPLYQLRGDIRKVLSDG